MNCSFGVCSSPRNNLSTHFLPVDKISRLELHRLSAVCYTYIYLIYFYRLRLTKADVRVYSDIYLPSNNNRYWDYDQDKCNQQESCEECGVPGLAPALQGRATCIANNAVVDMEED